jgi:hypothetical protein
MSINHNTDNRGAFAPLPVFLEESNMNENDTMAERLHYILCAQFGDDWRKDISLTLRADALYWFVYLAEQGIEAKRKEFKSKVSLDASDVASLASWTIDLENLLSKVQAALPPKKNSKNK